MDTSEIRGQRESESSCASHGCPLGYPVAEWIAAVRGKDSRYASTAHTVQEKARRLLAAAGLVQARIRPVMGGDRPSSRRRSRHRKALVAARSAAQLSALEGASGPGRRPGPRSPVQRVGSGQPVRGCDRSPSNAKRAHIWLGSGRLSPRRRPPTVTAVSAPRRPAPHP